MLRAKLITLYFLFCQLSVIGHILTNQVLRCLADGGFEKLKRKESADRFFSSRLLPLSATAILPFWARDKLTFV